jgi:hypothetical protein
MASGQQFEGGVHGQPNVFLALGSSDGVGAGVDGDGDRLWYARFHAHTSRAGRGDHEVECRPSRVTRREPERPGTGGALRATRHGEGSGRGGKRRGEAERTTHTA